MYQPNLLYPMGTMFPAYVDSALIPLLVRQLKKKGLNVEVTIDHNNALMYLVVNNVLTCNLVAIFYDLLNTPPINHRGILNNWADRILDQIRMEAPTCCVGAYAPSSSPLTQSNTPTSPMHGLSPVGSQ